MVLEEVRPGRRGFEQGRAIRKRYQCGQSCAPSAAHPGLSLLMYVSGVFDLPWPGLAWPGLWNGGGEVQLEHCDRAGPGRRLRLAADLTQHGLNNHIGRIGHAAWATACAHPHSTKARDRRLS